MTRISEQILLFEKNNTYKFIFGMEESFGCLVGDYTRDKDACAAVVILCEIAAFYKLQRYSYNGSGDSYGVGSCDIRRFFRDLWECSHRLKDAVLENKDFESIITARNDPQTVVYCDPPYYEAECYTVEFPRSDHQRLHDVLVKHTGFAMVSYNNCPYIRELYDDFFIYEVERPNSQSKKKNNKYREYIMTNYDPRTFAPQMSFFGDYDSRGKSCRLVHTPQRPLKV